MLSRFILKPSHLRFVSLLSSKPNPISRPPSFPLPNPHFFPKPPRFYSTNDDDNNNKPPDLWNFSSTSDPTSDSLFSEDSNLPDKPADEVKFQDSASWAHENEDGKGDDVFKREKIKGRGDWESSNAVDSWAAGDEDDKGDDIFKTGQTQAGGGGGGGGDWGDADNDAEASWDFSVGAEDEGKVEDDLFKNVQSGDGEGFELEMIQEQGLDKRQRQQLQAEEKGLRALIKGPDRAFGDLIAASGITDEMLDSLIALKDLEGIQGLPPLSEIEDLRYDKNTKKSSRADIERQKQEEVTKARVRKVDSKGRAYGTGKRKCSIARVWIQPGDGKFIVNDQAFDAYFPVLDHRATLLRPFTETKTLGTWDIKCTVKGGGVSGQVGAVRLGISRALQCWDPNFRPPLKAVGFMTRDSRIVERKKPGRAKARKSFQWVKR